MELGFILFIAGIILVSYLIFSLISDFEEGGDTDNFWCILILLFWLFDDD